MGTPANSLNLTTAGIVRFDGVSVFSGLTTTVNRILVGTAGNGIAPLGPGIDDTVLLGRTGLTPIFGAVPAGALPGSGEITLSNGTNISVTGSPIALGAAATINVSGPPSATTLTNHGVVIGQAGAAVTATAAGSAGQVLQSGGASADPTYSTPTYPSASGTSRKMLVSDGTNNVYSTETWAVPGTSGNVLTSDGTNWTSAASAGGGVTSVSGTADRITSTGGATPVIDIAATYVGQTSITTLGTVATGTWSATTIAANKGGTGTVTNTDHGVLIGRGAAAIEATAAGSAGQILQSGGAAANPVYSTATYPATATTTGQILRADGTNWTGTTATYPNTAGTSGNVLTSDGTNWTSATPSGGSFFIPGNSSLTAFADSTTYNLVIFGSGAVSASSAGTRTYIPKACTLTVFYGFATRTGTASTESITVAIRLNDTSNTNITTSLNIGPATSTAFSNTGLGLSLAQGDFIDVIVIVPSMATNPTNVAWRYTIGFN